MNKMPEVAKMLGVEYQPMEPDFEVFWDNEWRKAFIKEDGLVVWSPLHYMSNQEWLVRLLGGKLQHRPIPRYTIPEDLPVDAKVWVRNDEDEEWFPTHFKGLHNVKTCKYSCWCEGRTSHTINKCVNGKSSSWPFCITDEEYQKRQED